MAHYDVELGIALSWPSLAFLNGDALLGESALGVRRRLRSHDYDGRWGLGSHDNHRSRRLRGNRGRGSREQDVYLRVGLQKKK